MKFGVNTWVWTAPLTSEMSFEWQLVSNEEPVIHLGGEDAKHAAIKDYAHLLPDGIREFTTKCVDDMAENKHPSVKAPGMAVHIYPSQPQRSIILKGV